MNEDLRQFTRIFVNGEEDGNSYTICLDLKGKFLPGKRRYRVPGVISVLMKSAEIGTAARMREHAANADLLLRPPVSHFGLTDIKSFSEIVDAGYEHAREQIGNWMSADERAMPRSQR